MRLLRAALGRFRAATHKDHRFAIRLMEHLVVPTFVLDAHGRVLIWNKACERLTGVEASEIIGSTNHWQAFYDNSRPCLADLVLSKRYRDIDALYSHYAAFGMNDSGITAENWCVMPRLGRRLYLAIDAGPIFDENGGLLAVVETLRDITLQKEAQWALESLAIRDSLTGLHNRRGFDNTLDIELRRTMRETQPLSLLMIDIDFFKAFNDENGHLLGDECLKSVAGAIAATLRRPGDIAARYGGEEFAVILSNTPFSGAALIAEDLRRSVKDLNIPHAGSPFGHVTLSIGAATVVGRGRNAEELVACADAALYRAKRGGRDRIEIAAADRGPAVIQDLVSARQT